MEYNIYLSLYLSIYLHIISIHILIWIGRSFSTRCQSISSLSLLLAPAPRDVHTSTPHRAGTTPRVLLLLSSPKTWYVCVCVCVCVCMGGEKVLYLMMYPLGVPAPVEPEEKVCVCVFVCVCT
jgi:hypothetical protein